MPSIMEADRELSPTEAVDAFSREFDRQLAAIRRNASVLSGLSPHAAQSVALTDSVKAEPTSEGKGK